jgi:arylsulfatase A-like enzyme
LEELKVIAERRRCRQFGYEGFFMWLSYLSPHVPCDPPEPYFSMYDRKKLTPFVRNKKELENFSAPLKRSRDEWRPMDDEWMYKLRAQYMGDVTLVDHQIKRVLDILDDLHLRDNTLIVFTADHGDYLGDHWLQQKGFFHEPSVRVPLIFNGPGVSAGQISKGPATLLDLYPTILDYEDLWMPTLRDSKGSLIYQNAEEMPGLSLLPVLEGAQQADMDRVVISESAIYGQHLMIRYRNMKYNHYFNTNEWDVFDLDTDPGELRNMRNEMRLADLPAPMQAAFADISSRMERWKDGSYFFNGKLRPMFT